MANNFRGTRRKLYNPSEAKYLSDEEARKEYAALRKVANRRASRLRQSGFGGLDVSEQFFPPQSSLSDDEIKAQLLDVSRYLRDPRTTRPGMREYQKTMEESLGKYTDVVKKDPKKFGDFMESARRRAGGRLFDSARVREAYEQAVSRGMRPKTLEKHFSQYLNDQEKLKDFVVTLSEAPRGGRLTYKALQQMLI